MYVRGMCAHVSVFATCVMYYSPFTGTFRTLKHCDKEGGRREREKGGGWRRRYTNFEPEFEGDENDRLILVWRVA